MELYYILPLLILVFLYLRHKFNYWSSRGIPQSNLWNPLGDMWDVGTKYHIIEKIDVLYKKFKGKQPLFGFYAMINPIAIVTDLDLLRSIMVKDFNNFIDRGMYINEEADPLTMHMFNIEGEKWRRIRNSLSPTFTSGKIKGMFHIIEDKTKDLISYITQHAKNADGVVVKEANSRFTADVVASTAFGLETGSLREEKPFIIDILKRIFGEGSFVMLHFMFLSMFPKLAAKLKLRQFDKDIEVFFANTIKNNIEHREKNKVKRNDFLSMLINLMKRGNISESGEVNEAGKLSFNEILAQAFLFFFAGYETSSIAMSFAMYYLSKDKKIQSRLREEVRQTRAKHGGELNYEALMEMTYLNQVFNETLRIFSPAGILLRKPAQDYKIPNSNLILPKDVMIQIPVHSIHNDPEYFPNPKKFDPERFTPEEVAKRHPYAFIPFGEGPRNCIGMRFAQLQAKYALAVVVETFELSLNSKTIEPIRVDPRSPNLHVKGGLYVNFKKL